MNKEERTLHKLLMIDSPHITFEQFIRTKPFFVKKYGLVWSTMCICPRCTNLVSACDYINKLADQFHLESKLCVENLSDLFVCQEKANESLRRKFTCLQSKNPGQKHCFIHSYKMKSCDKCTHRCDQTIEQHTANIFENVRDKLDEKVLPFPHFDTTRRDRPHYIPDFDPLAQTKGSDGLKRAEFFINSGIYHFAEMINTHDCLKDLNKLEKFSETTVLFGSSSKRK